MGSGRLPFDTAADAGDLRLRHGFAGKRCVDGRSHVRSRYRLSTARTTVVELAAIDETAIAVEQVEVRRARRLVCARYELRLVVEVRKREALFTREFRHLVR